MHFPWGPSSPTQGKSHTTHPLHQRPDTQFLKLHLPSATKEHYHILPHFPPSSNPSITSPRRKQWRARMVPFLRRATLTSPRVRSCGVGPLSGPRSRSLQRHTLEVCPGQLDAMGPTIDTGRRLERPPLPPPSPCDQLPKRRAEIGGAGRTPDVRTT